jgi:hypothetical protein
MKRYYENLFIMMKILFGWALDPVRDSISQLVGVYYQGILNLKAKCDLIDSLNRMLSITGVAMDKKALRRILCNIIISIIKPVKSYAIASGNNTLKEAVSLSFSTLMGMKTQELINKARTLFTLISPLVAALSEAGYFIDDALMTSMNVATDTFEAAQNSPTISIKQRKAINASIMENMLIANAICHDVLDLNSISFQAANPDYYREYNMYRHADQTGGRHNRLLATLVSELETPFINCTVTVDAFTKDGRTFKAVSANTDINGNASVEKFESGIRTVTVSGDSITTQTFGPFRFVNGQTLTKSFTCQPSFNLPAPQETNKKQNA